MGDLQGGGGLQGMGAGSMPPMGGMGGMSGPGGTSPFMPTPGLGGPGGGVNGMIPVGNGAAGRPPGLGGLGGGMQGSLQGPGSGLSQGPGELLGRFVRAERARGRGSLQTCASREGRLTWLSVGVGRCPLAPFASPMACG